VVVAEKRFAKQNLCSAGEQRQKVHHKNFKILTVYDKCASPFYLKLAQLLIAHS
jgi:hypothetical protein